jgi:hypothetical protein
MGNFVSVFNAHPHKIMGLLGSGVRATIDTVLKANPMLRDEDIRLRVAHLVNGAFNPGEQPDGAEFVYAFQAICRTSPPTRPRSKSTSTTSSSPKSGTSYGLHPSLASCPYRPTGRRLSAIGMSLRSASSSAYSMRSIAPP